MWSAWMFCILTRQRIRLFSREEVMEMLEKGEIWQSLMAAPLWKYFAKAK